MFNIREVVIPKGNDGTKERVVMYKLKKIFAFRDEVNQTFNRMQRDYDTMIAHLTERIEELESKKENKSA